MDKAKQLIIFLPFCLLAFLKGITFAQSGIYDRIGIIPEHGFHGAVPEENIDLFTGNLTLRFLDVYLSGPNGFDLKLWRVYNSKILKDRLPGDGWGIQQEPYSWVGMGWSMHMGRVHYWYDNTLATPPVIEFPDGRRETAYGEIDGSECKTRDFLRYDHGNHKLYFKDGTVWTFGEVKVISYSISQESVRVVTKITDSYGHEINITYDSESSNISRITDSLGRTVDFYTSGGKLSRIEVKDAHGTTRSYYYTVGTYPYGGYSQLTEFDPPLLDPSTYEYDNGQYGHYELRAVNTSYGGRMEYTYDDHTFYFYVQPLYTRVMTQKKIRFSGSSSFHTWNYSYPSYLNSETGTVTVDGPEFDTSAEYHAYASDAPWRIGLLKKKWSSDGSGTENLAWDSLVISSTRWYVLSLDMGEAAAPLITSIEKIQAGNADTEERSFYERDSVKKYGLPTKIEYWAEGSRKAYKDLTYFYESDSTFEDKYMVSLIKKETTYNNGGSKLRDIEMSYYSGTGNCGAIDWIKKWKSGSTYLTWDYTYSSSNPNFITITINLPGDAGTETYEYRYGTLSKIIRPGYTELSRSISQYDSSILSETNQHGGSMDFSYDALGRITHVNMPSGFNGIDASWSTNSVSISQGGNTVVKYWDGLGRETGHEESGDGITLYYRKTLDPEGRVIGENKGSQYSSDKYQYEWTASGLNKKITDPRGKVTSVSISGDKRTVTDPAGRVTELEYEWLAGLVSRFKDAQNRYCVYTYDSLGRLLSAEYNGSRTQSYSYDGLDNVLTEAHPETGSISYAYNSENNLSEKSWAGTQITYAYNASNQITNANSGDETIIYSYDSKGRVSGISSNKGWSRTSITYNSLGSVTGEQQTIPGISTKSLTYAYNANNVLASITYPDGKTANYTNNGLNMPETLSFNGKSLINAISYGHTKQPTQVSFSGNDTEFYQNYNSIGATASATLKKGSPTLYDASYSYDNVGNITSISSTTPSLNATYEYDSLNRLTSAAYSTGDATYYSFSYDDFGNLRTAQENSQTVFSATFTSNNRISSFSYDGRGNLTSAPPSSYSYVWDNKNRLQNILNAGISDGQFLYDERGLRLKAERPYVPPPSIYVSSPNGGERWVKNTQHEITWTSQGMVGNINIEYTTDNGQSYNLIVENTENDGSYQWTVPDTTSTNCLVRISESDGDPFDVSDSPFYIVLPGDPTISLNHTRLNFGHAMSGTTTSSQTLKVNNGGPGTLIWTLSDDAAWLSCSPTSGVNYGAVTVSVNASGLGLGTYIGHITVSDPLATNSPQQVEVKMIVYGSTGSPYGCLDIPSEGQTCQGTVAVCGWALDDIEVQRVEVKRAPVASDPPGAIGSDGLVFIGNTVFVEGARPDVEAYAPDAPFNYRAGWGYALLTYGMPDNGMHGWFTLYAIAFDKEGNRSELGHKSIYCDNEHNVKPFGTIDTPDQGGTASGTSYLNWGWVLTPQPDYIPYDGSTITVWVNGVCLGHPTYNLYRQDIAQAFPGYANSNGAVGYFYLNTTLYANGLHNIGWYAVDSSGDADGIGSRHFWIENGGGGGQMMALSAKPGSIDLGKDSEPQLPALSQVIDVPVNMEDIAVSTGFVVDSRKTRHSPDAKGTFALALKELDRVEIQLSADDNMPEKGKTYSGYLVVLNTLRTLPVGSTFDAEKGMFYWQPGPAFLGDYEFVFLKEKDKEKTRKSLKIRVGKVPKIEKSILPIIDSPAEGDRDNPQAMPTGAVNAVEIRGLMDNGEGAETALNAGESSSQVESVGQKAITVTKSGEKVFFTTGALVPTYYFYSYDGKLLAEYDQSGNCVRDYIYAAGRLVAEYKPQENKYYYYTSDQISSVRMITDDAGNVVYSAAYSPFGKVQKTWTNAYDPKMKFSGKERENGPQVDYFGARYYANLYYRFLSVDPVINRDEAISNPQLWNLYAYCRNNPMTFMDPDGRVTISPVIDLQYVSSQTIRVDTGGRTSGGYTDPDIRVTPSIVNQEGGWAVRVNIKAKFKIRIPAKGDEIYQYRGLLGGPKSPEQALKHELGHLLINMNYIAEIYRTAELLESVKFPSKFAARVAAAGFTAESFAKMWGPNVLATFVYDFLGIPLIK